MQICRNHSLTVCDSIVRLKTVRWKYKRDENCVSTTAGGKDKAACGERRRTYLKERMTSTGSHLSSVHYGQGPLHPRLDAVLTSYTRPGQYNSITCAQVTLSTEEHHYTFLTNLFLTNKSNRAVVFLFHVKVTRQ